jgi:hypothetical protein
MCNLLDVVGRFIQRYLLIMLNYKHFKESYFWQYDSLIGNGFGIAPIVFISFFKDRVLFYCFFKKKTDLELTIYTKKIDAIGITSKQGW